MKVAMIILLALSACQSPMEKLRRLEADDAIAALTVLRYERIVGAMQNRIDSIADGISSERWVLEYPELVTNRKVYMDSLGDAKLGRKLTLRALNRFMN